MEFPEKAHGKGAPDGMVGAIKRDAELNFQHGGELHTPLELYAEQKKSGSTISHYWISKESVEKFDEPIPLRYTWFCPHKLITGRWNASASAQKGIHPLATS